MKLLILHLNLDFRKTRNVQNRTPYPKAKSQKEEEILNVLIDLQIKNSCNRNKYVSRNKLLLCPHIKVFILSPISNRHWSLPEVSRMPRRLDIPDNTITQSSKHTIIHSKFKIYLTDLNELLLVKSPIAIVIQSCKKFPRSFSFSHAIIKIGKHHYRFHSIKWKKKGLSPGSKLCMFLSGSRSSFRIVSNTFIEAKITNYSSERLQAIRNGSNLLLFWVFSFFNCRSCYFLLSFLIVIKLTTVYWLDLPSWLSKPFLLAFLCPPI